MTKTLNVVSEIGKMVEEEKEAQSIDDRLMSRLWPSIVKYNLHALLVEPSLGGQGLSLRDYVHLIRQMGYIDGGFALATHVHNIAVKILSELMNDGQKQQLKKLLDQGKIFCLARSEANQKDRHSFATTIKIENSRIVLNGQKDYCTLAGCADYYVVFSQNNLYESSIGSIQISLVEANRSEVQVVKKPYLEALISSSTYSVRFNQCKLLCMDLIGNPGDIQHLVYPDMLALGVCGLNMGIADSVIHHFIKKIYELGFEKKAEVVKWLGEIDIMQHSAELLIEESLRNRSLEEESGICLRRAKGAIDNFVNHTSENAIYLLGIEGLISQNHFVQLKNDARATQVMPPNVHKCLKALGKDKLNRFLMRS